LVVPGARELNAKAEVQDSLTYRGRRGCSQCVVSCNRDLLRYMDK
jgi:aldehyde:ferredoxin oxidoreductase